MIKLYKKNFNQLYYKLIIKKKTKTFLLLLCDYLIAIRQLLDCLQLT